MVINISEAVVQRLEALAAQQGESVDAFLNRLLERYAPPGSLAELAQNARGAGLASPQPVDTAERSRDILNTEYADSLRDTE